MNEFLSEEHKKLIYNYIRISEEFTRISKEYNSALILHMSDFSVSYEVEEKKYKEVYLKYLKAKTDLELFLEKVGDTI